MHSALEAPAPAGVRPPGSPWNVGELPPVTRLSLSTIERLIRDGRLPSFKVGRRRLVPDDAVRQLIAAGRP